MKSRLFLAGLDPCVDVSQTISAWFPSSCFHTLHAVTLPLTGGALAPLLTSGSNRHSGFHSQGCKNTARHRAIMQ